VDTWYGWQTLIVDAASLGALFAAPAAGYPWTARLRPLGAGAYLIGGPIVHVAHGRWGRALASLSLRTGLPIVAALGGAGLGRADRGDFLSKDGFFVGLGAGLVGAAALDALFFASPDGRPTPWATGHGLRPVTIAPQAAITPRGTSFGVSGVF
jgi:hypothetical protein